MNRKTAVRIGLVLLLCVGIGWAAEREIGTISGPENELLVIDGQKYAYDAGAPFSIADKGRYLGKVQCGEQTFRMYAVRGTEAYLYCRWEWEGGFYRKQTSVQGKAAERVQKEPGPRE